VWIAAAAVIALAGALGVLAWRSRSALPAALAVVAAALAVAGGDLRIAGAGLLAVGAVLLALGRLSERLLDDE
jgi:hypothetical protein